MRLLCQQRSYIGILKGLVWTCLVVLITFPAKAQELQVLSVDTSAFPEIRVQLVYKGRKKFDENDLSVSQDNKLIQFTINESAPGAAPERGRAVFFLLEASGNTFGKSLIGIRDGMVNALDNLEPEDLINVGYFGSFEVDSTGLTLLNSEFTTSHGRIREALLSRLRAVEDTARRSDLYKNILSSLDKMFAQSSLPQHRLFIVLSAARNNSQYPATSSEVIGKAKEFGIPIHSLTILMNDSAYSAGRMDLISRKTGGKYFNCKSEVEITNAITDILNLPVPESMKDAFYEARFTVTDPLQLRTAKVDLKFKGSRQILILNAPNSEEFIPDDYKKYLWISVGIFGLIVVMMIMINLFSKRKSRAQSNSEEETELLAPIENQATVLRTGGFTNPRVQSAVVSGERNTHEPIRSTTPKPPVPSGPVLLVSQNGRTQSYPLEKEETVIGRHDTNDIIIKEITITGRHAVVRKLKEGIELEDMGSTNGTFVNGERIRKKLIQSGDRIRLGTIELTLKL